MISCTSVSQYQKPLRTIFCFIVAAVVTKILRPCACLHLNMAGVRGLMVRKNIMMTASHNNDDENCRQHADASALFRHTLDSSRLGRRHVSLESYKSSVGRGSKLDRDDPPKEFSLETILCRNQKDKIPDNTSSLSILIGRKRRGFGAGFYNCFGGKLEKDLGEQKHPAKGAVREVEEETGISIPLSTMEESFVGTINFTFDDWQDNRAMKVHLFCVFVSLSADATCFTQNQNQNANTVNINPDQIRGCDEIEPFWVHNCYDLPLHQMFADDSIWLPMLLHHHEANNSMKSKMRFDAWFHFHKGGAETNSIMHYYIQRHDEHKPQNASEQSAEKYNLEKKLFHALHDNHIHNPSIKEFKESWSFANSVRSFLKEGKRMKYVLDVAGGHGALGKLECLDVLLCIPSCLNTFTHLKTNSEKRHCFFFWCQNVSLLLSLILLLSRAKLVSKMLGANTGVTKSYRTDTNAFGQD